MFGFPRYIFLSFECPFVLKGNNVMNQIIWEMQTNEQTLIEQTFTPFARVLEPRD